jgi:hypothetical protein
MDFLEELVEIYSLAFPPPRKNGQGFLVEVEIFSVMMERSIFARRQDFGCRVR